MQKKEEIKKQKNKNRENETKIQLFVKINEINNHIIQPTREKNIHKLPISGIKEAIITGHQDI